LRPKALAPAAAVVLVIVLELLTLFSVVGLTLPTPMSALSRTRLRMWSRATS
jgi:hypothetical protein